MSDDPNCPGCNSVAILSHMLNHCAEIRSPDDGAVVYEFDELSTHIVCDFGVLCVHCYSTTGSDGCLMFRFA
jgi:hypothetical protein